MDNEVLNTESVLNVQQNIGEINNISDDDLDKKFATRIWTTTASTTRPDIKRMAFEEFDDNIVLAIKQNNRQESIKHNIVDNELFNKSSLTKIVPQRRL